MQNGGYLDEGIRENFTPPKFPAIWYTLTIISKLASNKSPSTHEAVNQISVLITNLICNKG